MLLQEQVSPLLPRTLVTSICHPIAYSLKHELGGRLRAVAGAIAVLHAEEMLFKQHSDLLAPVPAG